MPWRAQKFFRKQIIPDYFWFIFNGFLVGRILWQADYAVFSFFNSIFFKVIGREPNNFLYLSSFPFVLQIIIALISADFLEYWLHRLLHFNRFLWKVHKLHHSIKTMDWIGNMRFHPIEIIYYKYIKYFPLLFVGLSPEAFFWSGVISLGIGYLNHSNLRWNYGILRFVFNSPMMHIYHHDYINHYKYGQNFAIVFSFWDWIFRTAFMPDSQPEELGFKGDEDYPSMIHTQFIAPFYVKK